MTNSALTIVPHSNRLVSIFHLISVLLSLGTMIMGGMLIFSKLQNDSQQIPSLVLITRQQSTDIAILKEQQRNLDGKYAEIMLQLARLDAKLDKQNEYLFSSFQRYSRNPKDTN